MRSLLPLRCCRFWSGWLRAFLKRRVLGLRLRLIFTVGGLSVSR
ncbi:hypothetical protein [Nonomuraea sp. WAC 01424]|nr:hypothetical protein [Nonomuraea sp. WAC 01424]